MFIVTTGYTSNKIPLVFTEIFKVKIREQLPIDLLAKKVSDCGYVIDWFAEVEGALKLGINQESILKTLMQAYEHLYPDIHKLELEKVKWYLRLRPKPINPDATIKTLYK